MRYKKNNKREKTNIPNQLINHLVLFSVAIAGMLYGYDIGVINGVFLFVKNDISMTDHQLSLIAASVLGGGAIATLISGFLADAFGRKIMIMVSSIIFIVGILLVVFAVNFEFLIIGRLVQGISVGIITIVAPLYLVESMPTHLRGRGVVSFQLMLTFGIAMSTASGLLFISDGSWRGMFLTASIPAILLFIASFFIKESPRWLTLKGRFDEAYQILCISNSKDQALKQLKQMQQTVYSEEKISIWQLIIKKQYMVTLLVVCAIGILNQLTGINVFLQFSATILKRSGLESDLVSLLGGSGIALTNFIVTVLIFIVVDRFERRYIVAVGTAGIVASLAFCALVYQLIPDSQLKGYLILGGLVAYIACFAFGPGALVWTLLSELLPSRIRSRGMAIALFFNSGASAILASEFLPMVNYLGFGGAFWLFSLFTCLYFILVVCFVPKTKGKTLEEIEAAYNNKDGKILRYH
ncbi:sugar porter family MFS transporter [Thiotrichales bacterium 19S9-12]|nr:sugar porter family MFS transporter [Thiotrichales bacterium 19S9-11]MCF6811357.1 sugar porter family MFS transporter [Thiotrichales bacterium 19S9-12]